jgi:CRP-like cAMP-binding protein
VSGDEISAAIAKSVFGGLPADLLDDLFGDSFVIRYPAGTAIYEEKGEARCLLVLTGVIRAFLRSSKGRQVAFRYARCGDILGTTLIVGGPAQVNTQALTDSRVLTINATTLTRVAQSDVRVAWSIARDLDRLMNSVLAELGRTSFGSVPQLLARHLLDLAAPHDGNEGGVAITHQLLADAVGSVREVVGRAIRQMRDEGLIEIREGTIYIADVARLRALADIQYRRE